MRASAAAGVRLAASVAPGRAGWGRAAAVAAEAGVEAVAFVGLGGVAAALVDQAWAGRGLRVAAEGAPYRA